MIPEIGVMIGAYIVTRMLSHILKTNSNLHWLSASFAVVTILITLVVCYDLLLRGAAVTDLPALR